MLLVPGRFKAFQVKPSVEEEATEAHTSDTSCPFSACWCLFAQVGATKAVNGSSVWSFVPSFAASFVRAVGKKSMRNRLKASRDAGLGSTSAWILVRGLEARGDWGCVEVGGQQGGEEERRRGVDQHH